MAMVLAKGISPAPVRATRRRGKVDESRRVLKCAVEGANAQGDEAPRAELVRADSERLQVGDQGAGVLRNRMKRK